MLRNHYAIAWFYVIGLQFATFHSTPVKDELWIKDSCSRPLGLQDGRVKDSQLTASSSHAVNNTGPQHSRLNSRKGSGGWCHLDYVSSNSYEWIEVDFLTRRVITGLKTQGRYNSNEIPENYRLEYKKDQKWVKYKLYNNSQVLTGNSKTNTSVLRRLRPPIIARRIRLIPVSLGRKIIVCLRFEYFGCNWKDDPESYRAPQGDMIEDTTYNGYVELTSTPAKLTGGLGVLTDYQTGSEPVTSRISDNIGGGWLSWSSKTSRLQRDHVDIVFCYSDLRIVHKAVLNMATVPSLRVSVFRRLEISYSLSDDIVDRPADDIYIYKKESVSTSKTKWIYVDTRQALAKFVRIRMFFGMENIMISELQLQTTPFYGNQSDIDEYLNANSRKKNLPKVYNVKRNQLNDTYMGILIGLTCGVLMLAFSSVAFVCYKRRRCRSFAKRSSQGSSSSHSGSGSSRGHEDCKPTFSTGNGHVNYNLDEISPNIVHPKVLSSNGNTYKSVSLNDSSDNKEELISSNASNSSEAYSTLVVSLPPLLSDPSTTGAPKSPLAIELVGIQGLTGNSLYAGEYRLPVPANEPIYEFPRENLQQGRVIGNGEFGKIIICNAEHLHDFYTLDDNECCEVSVKSLNCDAGVQLRTQFYNEVKICSKLCHENITRMFTVCSGTANGGGGQSLLAITEYTGNGDLNRFLADKSISKSMDSTNKITYSALMYMAYQISSAMRYLSSCDIVHRDLAARNCLVTGKLKIKITDIAMSMTEYQQHYCSIDRVRLPIRWMSWEAIMHSEFTEASDVWAYGVTLWQLLSLCRLPPYSHLTDRQVMDSAAQRYHGRPELSSVLLRPETQPDVSKELYDLMKSCWHVEPTRRPKFSEVCRFLKQRHECFQT